MSRSAGAAPDAWVDEGPLPLHRFRQIPRAELLRVLDGAGRSKKLLFIEEELKPMLLSSVGNPTALTERGVPAQLPLRRIEKQNLAQSWVNSWPAEVKAVIYVMRPTLTNSHLLVRHASELRQYARNNGTVLTFHLLSVPRPSGICTRLLQDHGLLGDFGGGTGKLASMPLHAWPLDRDLLSMEDASVFRQLATSRYKDPTPLYGIGQALMFLLEAEGIVPNIKAIGHAGVMLKNLIVKLMLSREAKRKTPTAVSSRISGLVLIDRAVDVVAATALQTTFQGYIEEALGLEAGQKVVFQAPAAAPAAAAAAQGGALSPRSSADGSAGAGAREQMRVVLQPDDEVWQAYKEMALADVSGPVGAQQLSVTRELDSRKGAAVGRGVREMGALFSEIQALRDQSARLKQLTTLLEVLLDTKDGSGRKEELGAVDDFIASVAWGASEHRQSREQLLSCIDSLILQRQPLTRVLRLMTLYSAVSRPHWTSDDKRLRELMKQALACYGPQHAATLHALYAAGLLPYHPVVPDFGAAAQQQPAPSARNLFATLAQKLHLLMPDDQRPEELQRAEGTLSKRCFEADDPRYVLANTYMPLSAKLLELGVKGRWGERGVAEHLKLLPFPLTDARLEPGDRKLVEKPLDWAADITRPLAPLVGADTASPPAPVVVVVLIGGGPYAELSAMRMVLRRLRVRPLFLTTKVLNGTDLIRSFVPDAVVQAQDAAEQLMLSLRSTARGAAGANRTG